ncbi:MAG TPA: hypothetical protein VFJ06_01530, partial [Halococcus sp.]|nr:hypothetical protein [Halococcus sp.]
MAAIPRTNADKLKEVLAGYDKTADAGDAISDEAVEEVRDVGEETAKRQKNFLCEIGVLDKDGNDYQLTEKGQQLGNYIRFNQNDQARELFRDLLTNHNSISELLSHFDSEGLGHEDLVNKVGFVTANELTSDRIKSGAKAMVELLEWTDFIKSDGEGIYYLVEEGQRGSDDELKQPPEEEPETVDQHNDTSDRTQNYSSKSQNEIRDSEIQSGVLDIKLELTGGEDPENVRKLILAIRKGSEQGISE